MSINSLVNTIQNGIFAAIDEKVTHPRDVSNRHMDYIYSPSMVAGIAEIATYDAHLVEKYAYAFEPEFQYVVSRAKADLASNMNSLPGSITMFSYEKLAKVVEELDALRNFFKGFDINVKKGRKSFSAFDEKAGFYGLSTELMGMLRTEKESANGEVEGKYSLLNVPDMNLIVESLDKFGLSVRSEETSSEDILKGLISRYYNRLNVLDTFQGNSVDSEWKAHLDEAKRDVMDYLEKKTENFPFISSMLLLNRDPKNKHYSTRGAFAKRCLDDYGGFKQDFIVVTDIKKGNNLNRKHMEYVSYKLKELMNSKREPSSEEKILIDSEIYSLLKPVDELFHKYNDLVYKEVVRFIKEQGLKESYFNGFIGGDETWLRVPVSNGNPLKKLKKLITRIKRATKTEEFTLFGQKFEFRAAIASTHSYKQHSHGGYEFSFEEYAEAIERADYALKLAKEEYKDKKIVFVPRSNFKEHYPKCPGIKSHLFLEYNPNDFRNSDTAREAYNNVVMVNRMANEADIEYAVQQVSRRVTRPPQDLLSFGNYLTRIIFAGRGEYLIGETNVIKIGAKDVNDNTSLGYTLANSWMSQIQEIAAEYLGVPIEARGSKSTFINSVKI